MRDKLGTVLHDPILCCKTWQEKNASLGMETEGVAEGVRKVGCEFVHRCTVMLTSKLGSMRRMYCSMGW